MDQFTEVTSQSWFSRIGSAFKGILFGIILFIVAFPLLFWNEGRAVKRFETLQEGLGAVISLSSTELDASAEGKLVHTSGRAEPGGKLEDPIFNVSETAIKLRRKVEMYQWKESSRSEERKKLGGGTETVTTYDYTRDWSESRLSSNGFKVAEGHQNPANMPYSSDNWVSEKVSLGVYQLPRFMANKLSNFTQVVMQNTENVPFDLRQIAHLQSGGYYIGDNPSSPQVGDLRIMFYQIGATDVSVIAQQMGNTFVAYKAKAGGEILEFKQGILTADKMFEQAQQENTLITWLLRVAGLLVMTIGLNLIVRPLSVLGDVIPLVGNLVAAGTGIITFLIALIFSFITIAIAWIVYRPLLGMALLAAAAVAVYLTRDRMVKKGTPPPPPPGMPAA